MNRFDRKFGCHLIDELPHAPAVYLFSDESGRVLYVGKAKDARRRLAQYRNASRRKVHRKMRVLVRDAAQLEVRVQPTERAALALENELIRTLKPPRNVEGAYSFLYPAVGLGRAPARTLLCFTTRVDAWRGFDLRWYGVFRSRLRAKDAFDTLADVLARLGHRESTASLGAPSIKGSRIVGFRRLDASVVDAVEAYLSGSRRDGLAVVCEALLEKPGARRDAAAVQTQLRDLSAFGESDLVRLREALEAVGRAGTFVSQHERDALFIEAAAIARPGQDPSAPRAG